MELENYYTPKYEELVKGFEYEVKHTFKAGFLDLANPENTDLKEYIVWSKHTLEKDWEEGSFDNSFDLKPFLKNNTIRAKIK